MLISCHFAVLLISYMRANFGQQECRLDLTGSDVLEDFWSKNRQWVGNHHNYNFCDLRRNSSHRIRLEQIRVDPFAPEFAKPHPKQESIWARQYADGFVKVPLDDYPTPELVVDTLRDGLFSQPYIIVVPRNCRSNFHSLSLKWGVTINYFGKCSVVSAYKSKRKPSRKLEAFESSL